MIRPPFILFLTLLTLLTLSLLVSAKSWSSHPKSRSGHPHKNPFTPKNYPGLIITKNGHDVICYHGETALLAKKNPGCPTDIGCFEIEKDFKKIQALLKELKSHGNEVWPAKTEKSGFPHRIDPQSTGLKDWLGKGETATCEDD
ncbi:hypothetical protein K7432_013866 [Basidiobolus ranarum]|uniref:Uncharacterized protein n=1 Tax=Basidiobolus ranarum TaxID=34480 RepID=A0ABR2WIH7_9FUNG